MAITVSSPAMVARSLVVAVRNNYDASEAQQRLIADQLELTRTAETRNDANSRRLVLATYVLAAATLGLFIATVVLVVVTARL